MCLGHEHNRSWKDKHTPAQPSPKSAGGGFKLRLQFSYSKQGGPKATSAGTKMPNSQSWESSSFLSSHRPGGFQKSIWFQAGLCTKTLSLSASRLIVPSLIAPDVLQDFEHATIKIMRSVYKFSPSFSSQGDRLLPFFLSWETHEMTDKKLSKRCSGKQEL